MGNSVSRLPTPPMKIHKLHGKYLQVASDRLSAKRIEGYADSMFFGSRTVEREEKIELIITEMTENWNGSLRFGFTSHNPVAICNHPEGIPRFMCPDLIKRGGAFVESLNHIKLIPGDRINYWVTINGDINLNINGVVQRSQVTKLVTSPVWPVVDLYGNAVGLKFRSLNDDPDLLEEVFEARYYSSLNLIDMEIFGNPESIDILNKICSIRKDTRKAFIWNNRPLNINHIWVLFVNELDETNNINLTFSIGTTPPGPIQSLPETLQRLIHRPVVVSNIYCRNIVGDELAICIINDGDVMVALNGNEFRNIGKVQKSDFYWLTADLNCVIKSLTSLGTFRLTEDSLPILPTIQGILPRERNQPIEREAVAESNVSNESNICSALIDESVLIQMVAEAKCLQCKCQKPDAVFITCGDICCCFACANDLNKGNKICPKCNTKFIKTIKVFF